VKLPLPLLPEKIGPAKETVPPAASPVRLTIGEWLRFGPFLAQLVVTRRCNLTCGYCNEYDDHSPPIPFATLDRRLLKLHELRTWVVCLTGGEPTLHPELIHIVARMRELGSAAGSSSPTGISSPESHRVPERSGLTDLQISVDGVQRNATTVKVLEKLRGKLVDLAREHASRWW